MITITIEINEFKEGFVSTDQRYHIKDKTEAEHKIGRCLDVALAQCIKFIGDQSNSGELIEGDDIEMLAKLSMIRAFKSECIEGRGLTFR